jgi:UPF0271 protein
MPASIDLNADLGELPGAAGDALDEALLSLVTSANVACGGHAGDLRSMRRVCRSSAERGIAVGAHVSYPDRAGFGRRPMAIGPAELLGALHAQLDRLLDAATACGGQVRYIKAHGALYNASVVSDAPAALLVDLAAEYRLPLLTIADGRLHCLAGRAGLPVYGEFFADRAYEPDGTLRPRSRAGSVITDPAHVAARISRLVAGGTVEAHDGSEVAVSAHSICIHGDTDGALRLARRVRSDLEASGVTLRPFAA